jgi:hypothetical protein
MTELDRAGAASFFAKPPDHREGRRPASVRLPGHDPLFLSFLAADKGCKITSSRPLASPLTAS